MSSNEAIRAEAHDADAGACAQQLGTEPMDERDITWHPGDHQGEIEVAGVAGKVRMFSGNPVRIVFWPETPIGPVERSAVEQHLQDVLTRSARKNPSS